MNNKLFAQLLILIAIGVILATTLEIRTRKCEVWSTTWVTYKGDPDYRYRSIP